MASSDKKPIIVIKRIEEGGHGHHGGAWKVAYADFVTAMMCFFLVMWLMGSDEEVKATVEQFFNNPNSTQNIDMDDKSKKFVGGKQGDGDSILNGLQGQYPDEMVKLPKVPFGQPQEPRPDYAQDLKQLSETVSSTENLQLQTMQFVMPEDFLFKPGSLDFREGSFSYLVHLSRIAAKYDGKLVIEGFTGPVVGDMPEKADPYDFAMSRVVSVMAYLIKSRGMEESRIQPTVHNAKENPFSKDRVIRFSFHRAPASE